MTVKELREYLDIFPPDLAVYMSSDEEGNSIHAFDEATREATYDGNYVMVLWPSGYDEELF